LIFLKFKIDKLEKKLKVDWLISNIKPLSLLMKCQFLFIIYLFIYLFLFYFIWKNILNYS